MTDDEEENVLSSLLARRLGAGRSITRVNKFAYIPLVSTIGLDTLVKAGYDPRAAPQVFEVLRRLYGDRSELATFFHGDHPTNTQRIQALNARIAERYGQSRGIRDTAAYRRFKARYPN